MSLAVPADDVAMNFGLAIASYLLRAVSVTEPGLAKFHFVPKCEKKAVSIWTPVTRVHCAAGCKTRTRMGFWPKNVVID
jgi:hypothetical protein